MGRYKIPVGPLHVALEEPMYFEVSVSGETVTGLDITAGHVHRGLEYLAMKRNFYQNITLLERLCSLCSNSHPATFCMALESLAGIEIPARAEYLRMIADEIKRIASNLFNCGILAHIIGFDSLFMHVMQVREQIQDMKENIYGNRMDLAANCIGGVKYDIGKEKRIYSEARLVALKGPVDEIVDIFRTSKLVRMRTIGVGVISAEDVEQYGIVGPVARGSGINNDVRTLSPYAAYGDVDFQVMLEDGCDVWSRALVRLREARESIDIIQKCLKMMPGGPASVDGLPEIPAGEVVARTEAPRGELVYYMRTDGTDMPERIKWRVPSYMNWDALGVMMKGEKVADIPLIINSIDPCISCTER